jgi:RNA polymerase sigma-70 factor (sigma-E family)
VRSDVADQEAAVGEAPAAFVAFATVRTPALLRSAYALSGDWHLAQDLVQDTLLQAHLRWRRVSTADNPVAYVHSMLVRAYLTRARRRSFRERPASPLPEMTAPAADHDLNLSLMRALAELPRKDRAVLVLRYLEDRTAEQVAVDLRSTAGAVRVRSLRALRQLRDVLGVDPAMTYDVPGTATTEDS